MATASNVKNSEFTDQAAKHPLKTDVATPKTSIGGGITCCVPLCYNNSKRNPNLSWYVLPKDRTLRKKWLHKISRVDFKPSSSHRVCSAHFLGGKKTYMNNIPTIVPKTIKPAEKVQRKTRNSTGAIRQRIPQPKHNKDIEKKPQEINLEEKVEELKKELEHFKSQLSMKDRELEDTLSDMNEKIQAEKFTLDKFKHNEAHFKFYTGFETYDVFKAVLAYLQPAANSLIYWGSNTNIEKINSPEVLKRGSKRTLTADEEFFLTLVRLKCAFPIEDLSVRFHLSSSSISRIIITWIDFLHSQFRMLPIWASKETVNKTMPNCFKEKYHTTRVILDCTELFIEMPTSYRTQSATFSNYKHHNTAKGLVGIAPNGAITFVSDLYAGRFSDKKITKDSGIYSLLQSGDSIMADRGFDLDDDLPEGVLLNIPPFLNGKSQLSIQEENETRHIASVRVHVERAIERTKNFRILQLVFPLSMAPDLNKFWVVCNYLTNFLPQLVPDKEN